MLGGAFVCDCFRMRDDFVFDALEVFEKQRVVAGRCVFRIFARRDDYSPNDRIYDRARFAFGAEAEKRKELVVEGNGDRHISNRYLNMIDYRLHSPSSSFAKDENMKKSGASQGQSASE